MVCDKMKLVGEKSLCNKKQEEKIDILMKLRHKKDEEERIRLEQKKKEEAERLEEYYIMLKMNGYEGYDEENKGTSINDNKTTTNGNYTKLRRSFFTTDLVEIMEM